MPRRYGVTNCSARFTCRQYVHLDISGENSAMLCLLRQGRAYFVRFHYIVLCLQIRIYLLYAADTHKNGVIATEQNTVQLRKAENSVSALTL